MERGESESMFLSADSSLPMLSGFLVKSCVGHTALGLGESYTRGIGDLNCCGSFASVCELSRERAS